MSRVIIVSNRLPVNIEKNEDLSLKFTPSVGGLATGMKTIYKSYDSIWIGWSGLNNEDVSYDEHTEIEKSLKEHRCLPVNITREDFDKFYAGFSNETIWPLYHYFTQYAVYDEEYWQAYKRVNQLFADVILENLEDGDFLWIHDYHLQLLPQIIKAKRPDIPIGFFLHIPFPSYEIVRTIPWRSEILNGLLGADLIGFHTYDYERHFLSSVRRLLGYEINFNHIEIDNRVVTVDSFPMGIDYDKYSGAAIKQRMKPVQKRSKIYRHIEQHFMASPDSKLVLSIDRLDYSKGIANRLEAFEQFLDTYPEYLGKVSLLMLCVPSRSTVEHYIKMKSEIDELVGSINGKYASIEWTPIWYFYRSFPFEDLIELYTSCDIALITPIRDGMNLVAKEYIAARTEDTGVLILSEMAGVAKELSESLMINPNNYSEIVEALKTALEMPEDEQKTRMSVMKERIRRYNIEKWANDFMDGLKHVQLNHTRYPTKKMTKTSQDGILKSFKKAEKAVLFLDYDGTLVSFKDKPEKAVPTEKLFKLLDRISGFEKTELVLISGRDKETFTKWFKGRDYTMITEHGVWIKNPDDKDWKMIEHINNDWKSNVKPYIEAYVDRTPGSFIEQKNYSIAWHHRKCDPELGARRAIELKDELTSLTANHNLEILEGNKVIEIKSSGINKGRAAMKKLDDQKYDFILAIGDDWTDEYLFQELPEDAYTIKVGSLKSKAKLGLQNVEAVHEFLEQLKK